METVVLSLAIFMFSS